MDEDLFFFLASWVFSISTAGLLVAWLNARVRARRAEQQLRQVLHAFEGNATDERRAGSMDALRAFFGRWVAGRI